MQGGKHSQAEGAPSLAPGVPFAGRYRLIEELGRGGMARVMRAEDARRARTVALKYMRPRHLTGKHRTALLAAFEDEFLILDQLQHPRIVRVFDCGLAEGTPYYTMELLEGQTLERRLPATLPELCAVLRDVASCLALLHARGYLHRDITSHNVWCEHDGRAKLLDFGTMLPVGTRATELVGTPPYVPPEALRSELLDARSDLFALGALAYRALVGRHAYDVTQLRELPEAWRRGAPASPSLAGVPRALSDLVMELLSLDPAGRPATASEVMERLCAAVDIEPDRDLRSAQSYLVMPPLFGRSAVAERARSALSALESGGGCSLLVAGDSQMGHTRLLHQLSRQAPLRGVTHLAVDCRFAVSGALGVPRALCSEALARLPQEAVLRAAPHAHQLALLVPDLHQRLGLEEPPRQVAPGTLSIGVQGLLAWLSEVAETHPISIAVDGVEHCDGVSLGLFTELARAAVGRKLLLALSLHLDVEPRVRAAAEQLGALAERFELQALTRDEVEQLCAALFFGAEQRQVVATWLHHASGGAPGTCMALARHLLDTGLARYDAGRWHLPADPQRQGLPNGLREVLERRIASLSVPARRLAQALALVHDDTRPDFQPQLHLEAHEQASLLEDRPLTSEADPRSVVAVAQYRDELVSAGLIRQIDERSVIAHRAMAEVLRAGLSPAQAQALHGALARVLGERSGERLSTIRHLQLAGEHARALALLTSGGPALRMSGFEELRLSLAMECLEAALAHAHATGQPRQVIEHLVDGITPVLAVSDWSRALRVEQELERQRELYGTAGLDAEARLDCLRRIASQAGALAFIAARAHDAERLERMIGACESIAAESPPAAQHGLVARQALDMVQGRELPTESRGLGFGYFRIEQMPPMLRAAAAGVHGHAIGVWLAERCDPAALAIADGFDKAVPGIWQAAHMRWLAHGFRCEGAEHERWGVRARSVAPDDVWRRNGFLMAEARLYALHADLLALKGVLGEIEPLAQRFEGWRPFRDWARGEQHLLRGALDDARTDLVRAVATGGAGEHAAFGLANPSLCVAESRLGRHDQAIARAREGLELCRVHGLSRVALLDHQLALSEALSRQRKHPEAEAALHEADQIVRDASLGGIHSARALEVRVGCALRRRDSTEARAALAELQPLFGSSGLPSLAARYVRLQAELGRGRSSTTMRMRTAAAPGRARTRRRPTLDER